MIINAGWLVEDIKIQIKKLTDVAVLGLSGGADSTLVAILCRLALGKENVYGVHMPYNSLDSKTFNLKSQILAGYLGINDHTIWINKEVDLMVDHFGGIDKLSQVNHGNLRSRMRMIALYTFARHLTDNKCAAKKVCVVGTGNLSEDFIGYDTKGGDAVADFFPIGDLLKSEVYQLLDYFVSLNVITDEFINRVPSAGLWDGQTDEEELGYTYRQMEPSVLRVLNNKRELDNSIDQFVYERHIANKHKHETPYVIDLRHHCKE